MTCFIPRLAELSPPECQAVIRGASTLSQCNLPPDQPPLSLCKIILPASQIPVTLSCLQGDTKPSAPFCPKWVPSVFLMGWFPLWAISAHPSSWLVKEGGSRVKRRRKRNQDLADEGAAAPISWERVCCSDAQAALMLRRGEGRGNH